MKSIMQSIRPKWCELIANGKKTIEVRKTRPKIDPPFKVYMYCTKDEPLYHSGEKFYIKEAGEFGNSKVIGEYICDSIDKYTAEFTEGNCYEDIRYHYLDTEGEEQELIVVANTGDDSASCWFFNESCLSFNDVKEYIGINFHDVPFYGYHITDLVIYDEPKELGEFYVWKKCNSCRYTGYESTACCYDEDCKVPAMITRPPQDWCYVEELT